MDFSEGGPISRMSVTDVLERQGRGDENYRWFVEVTNLADRVVLQVADARDDVQKRTFTKWVNSHLKKHPSKQLTLVHDLYKDLRDGSRLIPLLEILTGERIPQERGKLRLHRLQNVRKALDVLKVKKVALVNIDNVDIVDGNTKLTLGLIWTIILHFQISDVKIEGQHLQPKDALLQWAKQTVDGVPGVHVTDFERSWRDGLAFNAIIYRNRPDLVDFPSLRPSEHKKNLRHAFTVAEKHLGVTSLLEPEDVDVPKPDERSIMTYVSSLYDVFPTVPPKQTKTSTITTTLKTSRQTGPAVTSHVQETVIHSSGSQNSSSAASSASAAGTDPQWEVYAQPARQMMDWAKRTANMMDDRSIPQSTAEIKRALADLSRFKSEELPTKEAEKQRLASRFREVERSTQATGQFRPPAGLHINNLESAFDSCRLAIQQREHILNSELHRMEQQDTLANKVSRQIPMVSADLDTIQARIHDAEGKADKMTAVDVRNTIDDIESASRTCDKNIAILMREVAQLRTNNHPSGPELDRKLKQLQDRLATLRNFQIAGTTQKVTTRTMVQGDAVKLERRVELRTERRFVEGNVDQFIQDCYKWVKNKESSLKVASYGDDLEKVQKALQQSKGELHTIREYERNISKCRSVLSNMTGEELQRNQEQIAIVEDAYKQLLDMAVKRVRDLEILLEFVQMATKEMMWMNQLEDEHANRDWSAKNLNIAELEKHYKTLMREIQGRERQFTSVQNHGERLMMENHPAKPCISDHLSAMQSQWNTVTQLANSLETHLKYAAEYFQFFYDTKELEQWMAHSQEILASVMDKKDLSQMEAQQLLQEVMKMKQRLEEQQLVLRDLQQRSKHIVHLKKRRQRLTEPIPIFAVCDYPGIDLNVVKGQEYVLLDNANRTKWRVVNRAGMEGNVPGVCFMIPPPNSEAIDNALQLEAHFKHLVEMWSTTQTRLQQWIQTLSQRQSTQSIDSVGRTTVQQTEQVPQQQQQIVQRIQNGQELQTRSTSARRTVTSRKETTEDGQTLITEEITEQMPDGETHRTVTTKKIRTQEVFPTGEAPQVPLERMAAPEIQTHRTVTLKQQTLGHEARPPQVVPPDRSGTFPQSRRHAMLQQFQENTEQMRFEEERRRREQQQQAAEMDLERRMIEEEHRRRERLEIERREEIRMMQEQMEAERQQVERIRLERHQQAEQAERQQAERIAYEQQQAEQLALERQREEERRLVEEMARERLDFEMTVAQQAEQLERESAEHIGAKRRKMDEMAQLVAKQRLGEQITATGMQYERTIAQQAAVAAQERQQRQAQQPRQPEVVESITPRQVRTPTPRIESQQHSLEDITGQLRSSQQDLRHKSLRRSETDLMQQDALETDQQQLQLQVTRNQYITSEQVSTQYTERRDDQRHVTTEQQRPVVDAAASRMGQVELVAQELAREVESCNRLIDEMSSTSQASISSEDRQVVESVSLDMDSFLRRLYKDEERLQSRVETPLPHTMEESRVLHDDFQTFHNDLAELQPVYDRISDVAAHILQEREGQFPKLAEKYHILNEKWDSLVRHSNACSERVALVTDIVHTLHRAREVITSCEKVLTLHGKMPGEMDKHQDHLDKIQGLQKTLPPFQPVVDKLNDEMVRVGSLSKTTPTHQDVQRLESEVHSILGRWKDVCNQTHERLKRLTQSGDLLQEFNDLLTRESNWISQAEVTLMEFEHVAKGSLNLVQQLGAAREFNKQVAGRQHYMMETNGRGEAFIGQAQSYDSTVEAYKTKVQGSYPRSLAKRETTGLVPSWSVKTFSS
ncbi:plectin-like [Acanthaster planci]|uniref:Plectin-like n=1 Tax=Acanthaster planci TaxID=133434 RepID=A0A8B7ZB84_ACAPL|nr:plectin-like [Acanthaster planci]